MHEALEMNPMSSFERSLARGAEFTGVAMANDRRRR